MDCMHFFLRSFGRGSFLFIICIWTYSDFLSGCWFKRLRFLIKNGSNWGRRRLNIICELANNSGSRTMPVDSLFVFKQFNIWWIGLIKAFMMISWIKNLIGSRDCFLFILNYEFIYFLFRSNIIFLQLINNRPSQLLNDEKRWHRINTKKFFMVFNLNSYFFLINSPNTLNLIVFIIILYKKVIKKYSYTMLRTVSRTVYTFFTALNRSKTRASWFRFIKVIIGTGIGLCIFQILNSL